VERWKGNYVYKPFIEEGFLEDFAIHFETTKTVLDTPKDAENDFPYGKTV
jgi:hypothetical protein